MVWQENHSGPKNSGDGKSDNPPDFVPDIFRSWQLPVLYILIAFNII